MHVLHVLFFHSGVYCYHSRSFLTACRRETDLFLPLAARKSQLVFPYRLPALTIQRARLRHTALPQAITEDTPDPTWQEPGNFGVRPEPTIILRGWIPLDGDSRQRPVFRFRLQILRGWISQLFTHSLLCVIDLFFMEICMLDPSRLYFEGMDFPRTTGLPRICRPGF